jgi:hypothetical protein
MSSPLFFVAVYLGLPSNFTQDKRTEGLRRILGLSGSVSCTPARSCYSVAGGRLGPPPLKLRRDNTDLSLE